MTVQILPRDKVGYASTYDVCAAGHRDVYNFPTYHAAKMFCEECGFSVASDKAKDKKAQRSKCVIYGLYKRSNAIRRAFGEQSFSYGDMSRSRQFLHDARNNIM